MVTFKRLTTFAGIAALGLGLAACSRNITRVEQVVAGPQACFECHSDANTFLVAAAQQWANSKHASGETLNEKDGECKTCHTSEGFVARASGTPLAADYVVENPTSIHCFTCHAPHTNGDFSVRWTTDATLMNGASADLKGGNLCVACHRSRRDVRTYVKALTLSTRFGPHHGPQGDMLIGSNGYEYAGYEYEQTNHHSATTDGCLDCHMKTTLQNVVGGHSFNMSYGAEGAEILNTAACAKCHGEIGDFAEVGGEYSQASVDILVAQLEVLLVNAGFITMDGETAVPNAVAVSAGQAGAVYNLLLVKEDRSHGVHNPKYMRGLLQSSIDFMTPLGMTATHAQQAMGAAKDKR
jgi:hypothetical protein